MTTGWSDGYVSDISYTHGFYRELAPVHIHYAGLLHRLRTPAPGSGLTFCELGCGQGYTTNVLAAANPHIQFVANDFNPSQISGAAGLARDAGLNNVRFLDDSFAEMVERTDLPQFDVIVLHGIYSWISTENRLHIVEFIRRRLKVGGVVYISYNAMPGWAASLPLRRLLVDEAERHGGIPIVERIDLAIKVASELSAGNAGYFRSNPSVGERLSRLSGQPRRYVAHEYFNKDWTPFYFADVAKELSAAKLDWAYSATITDGIPMISLSSEHQKMLAGIQSPAYRESLRDYLINQQFRRDIFAKGHQELPPQEAERYLMSLGYMLVTPRLKVALQVQTTAGTLQLQEAVYNAVLDGFAGGPIKGIDLVNAMRAKGLQAPQAAQALSVLSALGYVIPLLPPDGQDIRREVSARFNVEIMRRAEYSDNLSVLASPVSGTGMSLDRISILFLSALRQNMDPVDYTHQVLERAGQRVLRDGKPLSSAQENQAELLKVYREFVDSGLLNICKHLQLV